VDGKVNKHASIYKYLGCSTPYINNEFKLNKDHFCGNKQNRLGDFLASVMPLLGPEPALGIPKCMAREAIKSWNEYQHFSTWKVMPGCRHG
jgi:hypothetical protein